ncbi:hypothetical protein [Cryptosporidium parvum Iowa II]|uniref:Ubiquitin-like domain-containing protein n=2 Tax=Cryptosporidium parvum TaxID=5807 RepID=Q5CYM6_CRYPI|nr:hypothetical protein [Cryptosporidium parvum Iowa II]EAK90218.1 hypothetical protein cgd7_1770 [Cryptosporidium parvum Iowa II]QOY40494.1 Ubiquitin-related domain containing protein [Cryptosporidium parvum]WKS78863.1 hypothetical protein CPCDC_7g1770 [Cryptosporidium sp. 43IA8]WRK33348.1 Ubiquitin-related domain containing protein [Cryptosporidium parvum]|eukprot:QOY40494.1 hypothetical protein CPATCC_003351 [Cryptosporidium parvum]
MCEKKGLSLPPKNDELRREENESLKGESLTLRLNFKDLDGIVEELSVNSSTEVGFVKLLIAKSKNVQAKDIRIFHNGKNMINPMSLCDHPGVSPPSVDVDVYLNSV